MTPPDFEWVKARAECSPAKAFQRLKLGVEHDVEARNAILPSDALHKFETVPEEGSITVLIDGKEGQRKPPNRSVVFKQTAEGVSIRDGRSNLNIHCLADSQ